MSLLNLFKSPAKTPSLTTFLNDNNTPVNNYCNVIPIIKPSFISTSFGTSIIFFIMIAVYALLIVLSGTQWSSSIEKRLLISLFLGNMIFMVFGFNEWFNLTHAVIFCNDFKNGSLNLYQVSELLQHYRLSNFLKFQFKFYKDLTVKFSCLAYKQFVSIVSESFDEFYQLVKDHFYNK